MIKTKITSLVSALLLTTFSFGAVAHGDNVKVRSPGTIIKEAPASDWRSLDNSRTLYIELAAGRVIVELNPLLAPNHVKQLQALANEKFYDGLNFYRYVEGFVAQAGDSLEKREIKHANKSVKSERIHYAKSPLPATYLPKADGYAPFSGFLNGFAIGANAAKNQYWQTHCPGAFAMARSNDEHSGGTEFYIVIGQSPRYLDKNLTVFGQVRQGMQYLNTLKRDPITDGDKGIYHNQIKSIRLASSVPAQQQTALQVMKTSSASFKELIASRMNRPNAFFIERPNYVDVCSVLVPVRASVETK